MRIGVVSDTHSHLANTRQAVDALTAGDVERVLHCGDIGSADVVSLFDRWPTHFVLGNCDHDSPKLHAAISLAGQTCHGRFGTLELCGVRIALIHGDDHVRFRETIASREYRLVCYGHTHVAEHHYEGETLVLNPGALYRANPHSLAIIELPTLRVTPVELD